MIPFRLLVVLFIAVPLVEIYLFITVGGLIGAIPTIMLVVFTAVLGTLLLRAQGLATLARLQASLAAGQLPALELLEGVVLLVSGVLLLTPGFFTDAIGFAGLVTPLRRRLVAALIRHFSEKLRPPPAQPGRHPGESGPATLEGEFRREDD